MVAGANGKEQLILWIHFHARPSKPRRMCMQPWLKQYFEPAAEVKSQVHFLPDLHLGKLLTSDESFLALHNGCNRWAWFLVLFWALPEVMQADAGVASAVFGKWSIPNPHQIICSESMSLTMKFPMACLFFQQRHPAHFLKMYSTPRSF